MTPFDADLGDKPFGKEIDDSRGLLSCFKEHSKPVMTFWMMEGDKVRPLLDTTYDRSRERLVAVCGSLIRAPVKEITSVVVELYV